MLCMEPWKHLTIPMWLPVTQHSHSVTQCFHHSVCLSWTQVFLKEKERQVLRDALNKEVMRRIIILQRWFRSCLIRLHFLQKKDATVIIQVQFVVYNAVQRKQFKIYPWRVLDNKSQSIPNKEQNWRNKDDKGFLVFFRSAGVNFMRRKTELPQWFRWHGGVPWRGQHMRRRMTRRHPKPSLGGTGIQHTLPAVLAF